MAKKLIGFPYKYKCSKCGSEFTWDKDRAAHQRKCQR